MIHIGRKINKEQDVIELYKKCLTPKEICEKLGVSLSYYNLVVRNNSLAKDKLQFKKNLIIENHLDELLELYDKRIALAKIAKRYGTDKPTIMEILKEHGVKLRTSNKNKDLTGQTFATLKVIKKTDIKDSKGSIKYLCLCECGNEKLISANDIRKVKSCGCGIYKKVDLEERKIATLKYTFWDYRKSAKNRGYEFELSVEDVINLIEQNCHYCGAPPSTLEKDRSIFSNLELYRNGIDRKDNSVGYILENCVPCCTKCNMLKRSTEYQEFIRHIESIYLYLIKNKNT